PTPSSLSLHDALPIFRFGRPCLPGRNVHHEHPPRQPHLRGRQPDPLGLEHQLDHALRHAARLGRRRVRNDRRPPSEHGVGVENDVQIRRFHRHAADPSVRPHIPRRGGYNPAPARGSRRLATAAANPPHITRQEGSALALFGRKKGSSDDQDPKGGNGAGGTPEPRPEYSASKAKAFFDRAKIVHDTTNYEYAMQLWL